MNAWVTVIAVAITASVAVFGTVWSTRRLGPASQSVLTDSAVRLISSLETRLDKMDVELKQKDAALSAMRDELDEVRTELDGVKIELARYRAEHGPLSG